MKAIVKLALILLGIGVVTFSLVVLKLSFERNAATTPPVSNQLQEKKPQGKSPKRDHIPTNTVCYLGPCAVFDTNDDVTLYMVGVINGDYFAANNMLSGQFHFWLREKVNARVTYHGPYQGIVLPDAPKSTLEALAQFQICQVEILDGIHAGKIGWVLDTDLRCPANKGK
jgi:hypothetical protein